MKKYMIFGDSHVHTIQEVYDARQSNVSLSFFPSIGPVAHLMEFSGSQLRLKNSPKTWGKHGSISPETFQRWYDQQEDRFNTESGCKEMELENFDGVVIYGGGLIPVAGFDWWDFINRYRSYSFGLQGELLKQHITKSLGFNWLRSLESFAKKNGNVSVMLNPYLNEFGRQGEHESAQDLSTFQQISNDANIDELLPIYRGMLTNMGMTFISPPEGLYGSHGIKAEFKNPKSHDFYHLNRTGAKKVLNRILQALV